MIVVYYLARLKPYCSRFEDAEFLDAMKLMEELRVDGYSHVSMSTELAGSVGKPGVDTVHEGKTPDGVEYDWSKQHRGSGPTRE